MPLLLGRPAPLQDWPSHLARARIQMAMLQGETFWQQFYVPNGFFVPYAALDGMLMGLQAAGMSVDGAGVVFLVITFALNVAGVALLSRALGTWGWHKLLLGILVFYAGPLAEGYVNYTASIGLALIVIALWIRAGPWQRLCVAVGGVVAIFFVHYVSCFLAVVELGLLELLEVGAGWLAGRRLVSWGTVRHLTSVAAGVVLVGMLKASSSAAAAAGMTFSYTGGPSLPGVLKAKLVTPVHAMLDGTGLAGFVVLAVAGVAAAAILLAGRSGPRPLLLDRRGAALIAGPCLLALVLPDRIGNGFGLDYRVVPFAADMMVCVLGWRWSLPRFRSAFTGVLLVAVLVRAGFLLHDYRADQAVFLRFEAAARRIPDDSALVTAIGTERARIPWLEYWDPPLEYLATRAVRTGLFVSTVWAIKTQHTLAARLPFDGWTRILDTSTENKVADTRTDLARYCDIWRSHGHAGTVHLLTVYRSPTSDAAFPPVPGGTDPAFQLSDACAGH